ELRLGQRGVRRRRRVARQIGRSPRIATLHPGDVQGLRVFGAGERRLVPNQPEVAEVQVPGELRQKIAGVLNLTLHLLQLEVGGKARRGEDDGEQQDHDAKYPLRAARISTPRRRGSMRIARQPDGLPWLW